MEFMYWNFSKTTNGFLYYILEYKKFNNIYFSSFAQLLVETYITFGLEIEQYNSQGGEINKYQINYK